MRLLIGPWVHGSVTMQDAAAQTRAGDRAFGPAAAIDYHETILRFMDRYVRGLDNGVEREPSVRAFVMGENAWSDADAWPLPGTVRRPLFLDRGLDRGAVAPAAGRLAWETAGGEGGASSFVSDPRRPVEDPYAAEPGAHDYRQLAARTDVAAFDSAPLETDLRVVGPIAAEVHVSTEDAKDVDVWVKLFDVAPDGTAYNLMSPGLDVLRASYRGGGARELLEPGRVYALRFDNLMTGNLFRKGHRLRLVVCGSFFPHFSRNLQTGELETVSARTQPARIRVHHSGRHPSRLILPVVGR